VKSHTDETEITQNTDINNREGVLQLNHARYLICGSAPRKYRAAAAAGSTGTPTSRGRSCHWNTVPQTFSRTTTTKIRLVSPRSKCKQPTFRQYVESSNCSVADYDKVQWCCVGRR
jgi:hypothetical protein